MSTYGFPVPGHCEPPSVRREADALHISWAVLHCTVGDVLIACASFALASATLRGTGWPAHSPRRGLAMLLAFGLAYTVFSEWRNV